MKLAIALLVFFVFTSIKDTVNTQKFGTSKDVLLCSSKEDLSIGKAHALKERKSTKALSRTYAHYIRGILYDSEKKVDRAIEEYRAAQKLDPEVAIIHKRLAIDYLRSGKYEKAEEALTKVKNLSPEDESVRRFLADFYTVQKQFDKASLEYEQMLELIPDDLDTLASLADLYVIQENFQEAIKTYNKILAQRNGSAQIHFNLGIIYTRIEDLENAQENFQKALELDPDYLQAELALALINEINQDLSEAIKHYQLALEIDPLNINVYHRLAQTYYRDNRIEDAVNQYEFILKLNPYDVDAYVGLGYIYINEDRNDECIEIFEEALSHKDNWRQTIDVETLSVDKVRKLQDIKEAQIYLLLGLAYVQIDEDQEAIASYKRSIALEPEGGIGYFYLGAVYERTGERERAYAALLKSIELDTTNPDAFNYLGYMYSVDEIHLDEAQALIERALAMDPDNGAYVDSLGWIYFKRGMYDQALEEIERASTLLEDAEIFEHLGDVYEVKEQYKKAKEAWRKTLELDPERVSAQEKIDSLKKKR